MEEGLQDLTSASACSPLSLQSCLFLFSSICSFIPNSPTLSTLPCPLPNDPPPSIPNVHSPSVHPLSLPPRSLSTPLSTSSVPTCAWPQAAPGLTTKHPVAAVRKVLARLHEEAQLLAELSDQAAAVTWLKDGHALPPGPKYEVQASAGQQALLVHDVVRDDAGLYECVSRGGRIAYQLLVQGDVLCVCMCVHVLVGPPPLWSWPHIMFPSSGQPLGSLGSGSHCPLSPWGVRWGA